MGFWMTERPRNVEEATEEACQFLKENVLERPAFVAFSGGKDSIVTAHLMKM